MKYNNACEARDVVDAQTEIWNKVVDMQEMIRELYQNVASLQKRLDVQAERIDAHVLRIAELEEQNHACDLRMQRKGQE